MKEISTISREALLEKLENADRFALVEVLPPDQFESGHLPGAISIPLGKDFVQRSQAALPEKDQFIVVYCSSADCDASPTAARALRSLGYTRVYDYSGGKQDWVEAGLKTVPSPAQARQSPDTTREATWN